MSLTTALSRIIAVVLIPSVGLAQWQWDGILLPWQDSPSLEAGSLVYATNRDRVVAIGGLGSNGVDEFDGVAWTFACSISPVSSDHAAVFDSLRNRCVVFGGRQSYFTNVYLDHTWTWDGIVRTVLTPAVRPSPRELVAMAYDASRDVCVLYGGSTGGVYGFSDTWEFDGQTWEHIPTPQGPGPLFGASMVFDSSRAKCVMFGGHGVSGPSSQTWEYDASGSSPSWMLSSVVATPPPNPRPAMVYNPDLQRVMLVQGSNIWIYDGAVWLVAPTSWGSQPAGGLGAVYDVVRHRLHSGAGNVLRDVTGAAAASNVVSSGCTGNLFGILQPSLPPLLGGVLTANFSTCYDWDQHYYLVLGLGLVTPVAFSGIVPWAPNEMWLNNSCLGVSPDIIEFSPWVDTMYWGCTSPEYVRPIGVPRDIALAGAHVYAQVLGWQHNGVSTYWGLSQIIDWKLGK